MSSTRSEPVFGPPPSRGVPWPELEGKPEQCEPGPGSFWWSILGMAPKRERGHRPLEYSVLVVFVVYTVLLFFDL